MKSKIGQLVILLAFFLMTCSNNTETIVEQQTPIIVVTDTYHPYQDPGDNFDLIMGYALQEVDLKAIILDITKAFRKPVADHSTLWNDPRGPREAGAIPVMQLNYIFDRNIPFAIGPMIAMDSTRDKMLDVPDFQQEGIRLLLNTLRKSDEKISILSFGSARVVATAFNREPSLFKKKVEKIHLSAGTDSPNFKLGKDEGANAIPGGEWNVALDVKAFVRLLRSDLPMAIYPCAAKDGAFVIDQNNTYWRLPNLQFIPKMDKQLQRYLNYSFEKKLRHDFLRAMDLAETSDSTLIAKNYPSPHHVWETPIWLQVTGRKLVKRDQSDYKIISPKTMSESDIILSGDLKSCSVDVRSDGRFSYEFTPNKNSNFQIYHREDPSVNQEAFQKALPELYKSFQAK